jgi:hypothetical protein
MAFSRKVYDRIELEGVDQVPVAYVSFDECIAGKMFDPRKVFKISRIGKLVEVDDGMLRTGTEDISDEIRADESGAAGDQNLHQSIL